MQSLIQKYNDWLGVKVSDDKKVYTHWKVYDHKWFMIDSWLKKHDHSR